MNGGRRYIEGTAAPATVPLPPAVRPLAAAPAALVPLAVLAALLTAAGCGEEPAAPLGPDLEPPAVVAFQPADGMVAVDTTAVVRVEFAEPVSIDSLAVPALRVEGPAGALAATVALDSLATALILTPAAPLAAGTDYRAVLAAGIRDLAGNARPDSLVVRFSTALAFRDIGRVFTANEISQDLTVLDVAGYGEVAGSPVALGVRPRRLCADRQAGAVHVLYGTAAAAGVRTIDARTLAEVRDSGLVLPPDAADLALAAGAGLLFVAAPEANALYVLDATTLALVRDPVVFERENSQPVRVAVSERFEWLLVGLDGGARLDARRLPSLERVAGFPVPVVERIRAIRVEEPRGRAWVAGSLRYAVVDLINPERTQTFQIPWTECRHCTATLWSLLLSPAYDRVYLMNRRQALAAVVLSDLEPAAESPVRYRWVDFLTELVQNPRSGELLLLGWSNLATRLYRVDGRTLEMIERLPPAGDKAVHMVLLP